MLQYFLTILKQIIMKISKLLPILFCFGFFFLNAGSPLPVIKFKNGSMIEKSAGCVYRIRVRYQPNATINVVVGGQVVVNKTYGSVQGNEIITVPLPPNNIQVATINSVNCTIYISCLASGAYYVLGAGTIENAQITFDTSNCSISD
jgi:hypothetical protein